MSQRDMMTRFVRAAPSTPSTPSASGARSVHHAAAARRLFVPPESLAPSPQATPTPSGISSQVSKALEVAEDSDDFVVNFSRIYYNGERLEAHRLGYGVTHKSQLAGKRKLSLVWRYGVKITYDSLDRGERTFWLCKRCHLDCPEDALKAIDGYKHVYKHMAKKHRIDVDTGLLLEADKLVYSSLFAAAKVAGSNRLLSHTLWEEKELQAALIDWVILRDVSFNIATSTELRGLLTWNRTGLLKALPSSASTITSYVRSTHALRMSEIKALLKTASSRLSISVDVWTSSNHLSFLGVVAHFSDSQYKQRDVLIAFRNLYGDHTGAAQAAIILDVLNEFDVAPRLQAFVGDNASNNDSELIKGLNQHPNVNLTSSNCIRCAGHIINLVVKATLYGKGVSQFENNLAEASPAQQYELFRLQGVVGKLHNFVNAVCASHKRRELFQSVQKESRDDDDVLYTYNTLQLRQDGGVRWHSVYYMLLRCLELRRCIQRFMTRSQNPSQQIDDDYDPLTDTLTEEEWEAVQQLVDFLQLPVEMTKRLEGSNSVSGFGSLWQTLTNLQTLWTHYNSEKVRCERPDNSSSAYFVAAIVYGEQKLNNYFDKLVVGLDVSYYCVATALHPALRLAWFQTHWKPYNSWRLHGSQTNQIRLMRRYNRSSSSQEKHLTFPYAIATYQRRFNTEHRSSKAMKQYWQALLRTKDFWFASSSRLLLQDLLTSLAKTHAPITKIVCFGLGAINLDKAWYQSAVQYMAMFTIIGALEKQYKETDPSRAGIKLLLQDLNYETKDYELISKLWPGKKEDLVFVSDPDGLLAIDAGTIVVSAYLPIQVPLVQIIADLFHGEPGSGPAMIIGDDMNLDPTKASYSLVERGAPHVARFFDQRYEKIDSGFGDYALEEEFMDDVLGEGWMDRKRYYWLNSMELWARKVSGEP
ncbi:Transposase protein [Pyrenophora teres f. teres]|uniref:Transposase protein n=1 Tax=Pyrenophora teres f. teres TaxID=97479 RepID=A0A6S6VDD8_9PLEO|nr:Transposase protein [Pyrenophora teres f. teres]